MWQRPDGEDARAAAFALIDPTSAGDVPACAGRRPCSKLHAAPAVDSYRQVLPNANGVKPGIDDVDVSVDAVWRRAGRVVCDLSATSIAVLDAGGCSMCRWLAVAGRNTVHGFAGGLVVQLFDPAQGSAWLLGESSDV